MKLAAIDIGTNSVHLVIVEARADRSLTVLDKEKRMVKLGRGLFKDNRLTDRAFESGVAAVEHCVTLARNCEVAETLIVATSATREARNGGEFLRKIQKRTGVRPRVITGTEEAELIFRAVREAVDLGPDRALVIDIGGGSTELVLGNHEQVHFSESLRLGVQRLRDRYLGDSPLQKAQVHELRGYIKGVAGPAIEQAKAQGFSKLIGTSGTIKTLAEAAHLAAGGREWRNVNAERVGLGFIEKLADRLVKLDLDQRADVDGIDENRADAIHLGGILLVELMKQLGQEEILLCESSLREGVVLDYLDRHGTSKVRQPSQDPRRTSVSQLARRYDRDDPHERHIAKLSLQIFDATRDVHGLGDELRELLEYAALLHDIGSQISFRKRHKHSQYIIRYSELAGFGDHEIDFLSQLARYHRRARPKKKKHPLYKALSKPEREHVKVLSGILRVAKGLDRGQSQGIKHLSCQLDDECLLIQTQGSGDLSLELRAARRRTGPLAHALGMKVKVEPPAGVS